MGVRTKELSTRKKSEKESYGKEKPMKTNDFTYKVMDLNTAQLEIPRETYQRELSPDRVRRIVKAFDERIANEPKVSYRGGHYYVFDGQHTIAARKLRNDKALAGTIE